MRSLTPLTVLLALAASTGCAQLVWWGDYIPRTGKPPVVFVTGHDAVCPDARSGELPFFQLTFGKFDEVMARDGRVSLVFEACYAPNHPPIEEIADVLRRLIEPLRYTDGQPVPELDIVAHSMGGLIVRSYLSGKQAGRVFSPPAAPRVRKVIFLGTPHFGTSVATSTHGDPQIVEMALGSRFLFDLATWNQETDDFNGADALAVAGTGGRNGSATDSVVTIGSASIDFVRTGRTAVVPYCHTEGGIGQLFLCNGTPGLARVKDENHPTARLVLAFLNDAGWEPLAQASTQGVAADSAVLMVQRRSAADVEEPIRSATLTWENGATASLAIGGAGIAYGEMLRAGPAMLDVDGLRRRIVIPPRGSQALVLKPGPQIRSVEAPLARLGGPRTLGPGMLVTISGTELNTGAVELSASGRPARIIWASAESILAELPEQIAGWTELRVRNAAGQHATRILVKVTASGRPAMPPSPSQ